MNKLIISGRLTKTPELRQSNNKLYANVDVAVQRPYKNEKGNYDADFFRVSLFGTTAEYLCKYANKGTMVIMQCRLQNHIYEQDGQRHYQDQIIVESLDICSSSNQENQTQYAQPIGNAGTPNPYAYNQSNDQAQLRELEQESYKNPFVNTIDVNDNDLPF